MLSNMFLYYIINSVREEEIGETPIEDKDYVKSYNLAEFDEFKN
jgi:hypothetical protein